MMAELSSGMKAALPVLYRLQEHGYEAVFVGGAVRDLLLGLEDKDVDIASSATPEQTMSIFPKCIGTGLQHGTVTVMEEGVGYEVTTYRQESPYEDHRRPAGVTFIGDLEGDLLRRDFTINAMALGPEGKLHDPFGGLEDLKRMRLRCVGNPDARLQEDALRMLRAIRFIGTYRLTPVLSTWRALRSHRALLRHVAMERVQSELDKMLAGKEPMRGLAWLAASGLLEQTKEPLLLPRPEIKDLSWLAEVAGVDGRYAALFIALRADADSAGACLMSLRMSKKRTEAITACLRVYNELLEPGGLEEKQAAWRRIILAHGRETALRSLGVLERLPEAMAPGLAELTPLYRQTEAELPIATLKELAVNGAELAEALGRKAGPWTKETLTELLHAVAEGSLVNDKKSLIAWAIGRNHKE